MSSQVLGLAAFTAVSTMALALLELVMQLRYIDLVVDQVPISIVGHVVDSDDTSGGRVLEGGGGDSADTQLDRLIKAHVVAVVCVQDAIGESTTRANSEKLASQPR